MKVRELIRKLKAFDPLLEVLIETPADSIFLNSGDEVEHSDIGILSVNENLDKLLIQLGEQLNETTNT